MKRILIAASAALALGASNAMAGGIQIDPTGTGSIGASKFLSDTSLGSSFGNFLATTILGSLQEQVDGSTPTGNIYGHNSIGLSSFGIPGAELTLEFELAVFPTVTGTPNSIGEQLSFALDPGRDSTFRLFFDDTADANMDLGSGYSDGVLIARSTLVSIQGNAALTNASGGITADNGGKLDDDAGAVDTISSNGSLFLDIDFSTPYDGMGPPPAGDFLDTRYIVNDLISASIDLSTDDSLFTPYPDNTFASDVVVGHTLDIGTDGVNNFQCSGHPGSGECGFQAKMNTTILTNAPQVPEPGSLALLGLGLGLFGLARYRKGAAKG